MTYTISHLNLKTAVQNFQKVNKSEFVKSYNLLDLIILISTKEIFERTGELQKFLTFLESPFPILDGEFVVWTVALHEGADDELCDYLREIHLFTTFVFLKKFIAVILENCR